MGNCFDKSDNPNKFVNTRQNADDLKKQYNIDKNKFLGRGQFGKVFLATNIKDPS